MQLPYVVPGRTDANDHRGVLSRSGAERDGVRDLGGRAGVCGVAEGGARRWGCHDVSVKWPSHSLHFLPGQNRGYPNANSAWELWWRS